MPEKDLKARLKNVGLALKHLFKPEEEQKNILDQSTIEKEAQEFVKAKGYDFQDPDFDLDAFQKEFTKYLKA